MELPAVAQINFVHPSTFIVSGPTGCGKTNFVARVLREQMLRDADGLPAQRIIWFYGAEQPGLFDELRKALSPLVKLDFQAGLDGAEGMLDTLEATSRNIVVIDDLMQEAKDDKMVAKLFAVDSHHANTSVFYMVQNLFPKGAQSTTISRNAHYFILFKNPRDTGEVRTLATQMLGGQGGSRKSSSSVRTFVEIFGHVTDDKPFSYLVVDLRPETWDAYRYRTDIFPGEATRLLALSSRKIKVARMPYATTPNTDGWLRIGPAGQNAEQNSNLE